MRWRIVAVVLLAAGQIVTGWLAWQARVAAENARWSAEAAAERAQEARDKSREAVQAMEDAGQRVMIPM